MVFFLSSCKNYNFTQAICDASLSCWLKWFLSVKKSSTNQLCITEL